MVERQLTLCLQLTMILAPARVKQVQSRIYARAHACVMCCCGVHGNVSATGEVPFLLRHHMDLSELRRSPIKLQTRVRMFTIVNKCSPVRVPSPEYFNPIPFL